MHLIKQKHIPLLLFLNHEVRVFALQCQTFHTEIPTSYLPKRNIGFNSKLIDTYNRKNYALRRQNEPFALAARGRKNRRNNEYDDDDDSKASPFAVESILSILSTPVTPKSFSLLPGPPLPAFYILSLILLSGFRTSTIIGSGAFFALFLILGRNAVFGGDDGYYDDGGGVEDGETSEEEESAVVDIIALAGSIITSYLVLPQQLLDSSNGLSQSNNSFGIFTSPWLVLGVIATIAISGMVELPFSKKTGGDGIENSEKPPSKALMDLWDEKLEKYEEKEASRKDKE